MEIKRSKKIHMVVEEEPKRKPSEVPVVEPEPEDSYWRINAKKVPEQSGQDFLESLKKSMSNKLRDDIDKRLAKEAKYKDYYSPIKVPNSDEIIEFTEKSEPESALTYEKMKEALEKFKVTNFVVAEGRQTGKTQMAYQLYLNANFKMEETTTGRILRKEKQVKAEALLENARRTPGNYWVTGDGRRIPIAEMSDKHLVNTIRFIFKKIDKNTSKAIQEAYRQLVGQAPWIPVDLYMINLANFEKDGLCQDVFKRFPKLQTLIREAATRGLSWVEKDGSYYNPKKKG